MSSRRVDEPPPNDDEYIYVKAFRHWRTGKLMVAAKYGHKAWRIRVRKRK